MPKFYIVDGNAYIHRAYHAIPPLTTSKGEMVNAVYGFLRLMIKVIKQEKPEYIAVCFDFPAPTFRHLEYSQYKANRKKVDDELKNQFPLAQEAVKILNIMAVSKQGFEADDIIATLAKNAEKDNVEVVIISGDKDALQLVNDKIKVLNDSKNIVFDVDAVKTKYGLSPDKLVDMFALMGDSSDNIPGVKGIGEKTAVKLIQKYGSLENLLTHQDSLEGKLKDTFISHKQDAIQSKKLVTLREDVPLDFNWQDCKAGVPDELKVIDFLTRLEFNKLLKDIIPESQNLSEVHQQPQLNREFKVNIVYSKEQVNSLLEKIIAAGKVSFDLETTSTNSMLAKIVGFALAVDSDEAYYIPVGHVFLGQEQQLSVDYVIKQFKAILEDDNIKKYGQNIKYDLLVLRNYSVDVKGIYFDTMIASYCLNPSKMSHGLKIISLDYLGYRMTEIEQLIGKGSKQITMDKVDIARTANYACADAIVVLWLSEKFEPQLKDKKLNTLFHQVEMPLIKVIAEMERFGIKIDILYVEQLLREFSEILVRLEKDIYALAGEEFNPNSPKQLGTILFEKLQLPVIKKTKTGYCTNEEILTLLSSKHELPAKLIEYREIQKLKSTYIDSFIRLCDNNTNRIHTSFNQAVTATGRLSSSDPNMQNIPIKTDYGKKIRKCFVAEKGYIFVSADYSQIDLRALAHISMDDALIKAFDNGDDIHSATAREIFNISSGEVSSELRRIAKTINFGIIYGMSAFSLAQQLNLSNSKAKEYIENYFNKYSGVKKWISNIVKEAHEKGFVTTILGRVRYLPEIQSTNQQIKSFAERMAMNTPIQGSSADIIKLAMINIDKILKNMNYSTKMLLQVHDELLFEVPEKDLSAVLPNIKEQMETAIKLKVPLVADIKIGYNWAEMKAYKNEMQ